MKSALAVLARVALPVAADPARWEAEVTAAERAFAHSMAERDLAAFGAQLSGPAVACTAPPAPKR